MRVRKAMAGAAFLALATHGASAADTPLLPLISDGRVFAEGMPDLPRVSGHRIAGVHIGTGSGAFDLSRFRLALGAGIGGTPVCVKVTTRDGRYWALNPFATKDVAAESPAIEFRTHLGSRLSAYDISDFAVRAIAADRCDEDAPGPVVPARLGPDDGTLVLFVNAGNPLSVGAAFGKPPSLEDVARCDRPVRGAMVSYNFICSLPIGAHRGEADVTVAIRDMSGVALSSSFVVLLP